jgi:hypothetical protein
MSGSEKATLVLKRWVGHRTDDDRDAVQSLLQLRLFVCCEVGCADLDILISQCLYVLSICGAWSCEYRDSLIGRES